MAALHGDIEQVLTLIRSCHTGPRTLIAIGGPPGSGKSTLAEAVVARLNDEQPGQAALVPMDGFHLDNAELINLGLLDRKGAPETFNAQGLVDLVKELKQEGRDVRYPLFDRELDQTLTDAGTLKAGTPIVVVEGNYLLLDAEIWRDLHELFDATVFLSPPLDELERRLLERWIGHGFSPQVAERKAKGNDLANAHQVLEESVPADLLLNQFGDHSKRLIG